MKRLNLTGGSYQLRHAAASAQRCLNLYPEPIPQETGEGISYVFYPTPGLTRVAAGVGVVRCLYQTSRGDLLCVIGNELSRVEANGSLIKIGTIAAGTQPVQISDNGTTLFIVDGTVGSGWYAAMPTIEKPDTYGPIVPMKDDAFYGSPTVAVLDTFFLFARPGTAHWYVSPAQFSDESTTPFDSLYIASAATSMGTVSAVQVLGQYIWVFGRVQTELWYDSGASDFPFQRVQGMTIECGCLSPHSIARCPTTATLANGGIIWLGTDRSGRPRVYLGQQTAAAPISTFAIEQALQKTTDLSQAIGSIYQQGGHVFYVLSTGAGSAWVYDLTTGLWHERCSLDGSGQEAPYRCTLFAEAYGRIWAGGADGVLYHVDPGVLTEEDRPIKRQRAFPHLLADGQRAIHRQLMLDMQNGSGGIVQVDWSDDRGATYCEPLSLPLGTAGNVWPCLWRLGLARDRVYRLTWTDPFPSVLMGVFLQIDPVRT